MANGFEKLLKNIKRMRPLLVFACFFFFFLLSPVGGFVWWVQPEWKEYAWKTRKKQREKGNSREKETEFVLFLFSSWLLFWNIYHSVGRILIFHIMFGVQLFICLPHSPFLSLSPLYLSIYLAQHCHICLLSSSAFVTWTFEMSDKATNKRCRDGKVILWHMLLFEHVIHRKLRFFSSIQKKIWQSFHKFTER